MDIITTGALGAFLISNLVFWVNVSTKLSRLETKFQSHTDSNGKLQIASGAEETTYRKGLEQRLSRMEKSLEKD